MALLIMIGSCNLLKMFANKVDTINDLLEDLGKNKFAIETNVYKTVKVRFLWFLSLIGLACVFNFLFWYCYIEVFNLGKLNDIKHIFLQLTLFILLADMPYMKWLVGILTIPNAMIGYFSPIILTTSLTVFCFYWNSDSAFQTVCNKIRQSLDETTL